MVNPQFFRGKYQYLMVAVHHIQAPLEQCLNPGWLMIIEDYNTQLCHTQLCHTPSFTYHFVTHLRFAWQAWYILFAWQAWHLWHWAGSGGALGLGRRWSPVTPRYFAWQAWQLATSTFVLRGRCGAW